MTDMRDSLLDIVRAVSVVPFDIVKVTGTEGNVLLQSKLLDDQNSGAIIFRGKLSKPSPEFDGVYGLSNISMLSGLTNVEAFREKEAKISIKHLTRGDIQIPEEIVFENPTFGKASYRLTDQKTIPAQMKETAKLEWNVTVENPSKRKISELALMAGIYASQETRFTVKTDKNQLKFLIGDESAATSKAQIVFAEGVTGTVKAVHTWSLQGVLNVLKLGNNGETTLKISDQGILQIEVDTGIGVYTYLFAGSN